MGQENFSILIVQSDLDMRDFLCEQALALGIDVHCSDSIRCALNKLSSHDVDAIICNETLKDGYGIELIERLKRLGLEIPTVMMLSGNPTLSEISALARGADLVLQRPFLLQDLSDVIRTYAGSRMGSSQSTANEQTEWSSKGNIQNSPHRA